MALTARLVTTLSDLVVKLVVALSSVALGLVVRFWDLPRRLSFGAVWLGSVDCAGGALELGGEVVWLGLGWLVWVSL